MWRRIKRTLRANLGRFADDPLAGLGRPGYEARSVLKSELTRLRAEEELLGEQIRVALRADARAHARELAHRLSDLRARISRLQARLGPELEPEPPPSPARPSPRSPEGLEAAAEATLERLEGELASEAGPAPSTPTPAPAPARKTLGAPGAPSAQPSASATPATKSLGGDPGPAAPAPASAPARKTLGPAPAPPTPCSLVDELERLATLLDSGALSREEFDAAKARLLS